MNVARRKTIADPHDDGAFDVVQDGIVLGHCAPTRRQPGLRCVTVTGRVGYAATRDDAAAWVLANAAPGKRTNQ